MGNDINMVEMIHKTLDKRVSDVESSLHLKIDAIGSESRVSNAELRGDLKLINQMLSKIQEGNIDIIAHMRTTNGRVTELEREMIETRTRLQTIRDAKQESRRYYVAPILVGTILGVMMIFVELMIRL